MLTFGCVAYMEAQMPGTVALPPHLFVHVFRAAAGSVLSAMGLLGGAQDDGTPAAAGAAGGQAQASQATHLAAEPSSASSAAPSSAAGAAERAGPSSAGGSPVPTLGPIPEHSGSSTNSARDPGRASPHVGVPQQQSQSPWHRTHITLAKTPEPGPGHPPQRPAAASVFGHASGPSPTPSSLSTSTTSYVPLEPPALQDVRRASLAMLQTLTQLVSSYMSEPQADVLRVLISLHSLHQRGAISSAELQFAVTLLREGPPADVANPAPPPQLLAPAASKASGALPAGIQARQSGATTTLSSRATSVGAPSQQVPGAQAALMAPQPRSVATPTLVGAGSFASGLSGSTLSGAPAPSSAATQVQQQQQQQQQQAAEPALLQWLEKAYPTQAFWGIQGAVASAPAEWRAALRADDLSTPLVHAKYGRAPGAEQWGGEGGSQASLSELARLNELAAALQANGRLEPAGQAAGAGGAVAATGLAAQASVAAAAVASALSRASASGGVDGAAAAAAASPGPLPEHWARARLRSPLHWFVLAVALHRQDRLAPACRWLTAQALGGGVAPSEPTPGERLLHAALAAPAACATVVASCAGEDAQLAVQQAAACWGADSTGLLRLPEDCLPGEREVVTLSWGAFTWPQLRQALEQCLQAGRWLLLLNCHAAPEHDLLALLHWMASHEHLLRGPEVAFRLFLALPHASLQHTQTLALLQQGLLVVLQPPASLLSAVRSTATSLAHSSASYVGFYGKASDHESHLISLAAAMAFAALGHTLAASGDAVAPLPSVFGWWDVLHALHLIKLVVAEARR